MNKNNKPTAYKKPTDNKDSGPKPKKDKYMQPQPKSKKK